MKNISPYTQFKNWLFDNNMNSELDDSIIKCLNKLSVLAMFGRMNKITIYLNDNFNTYDIMKYDDKEFYIFLKSLLQNKNISKYDTTFFDIRKDKFKYKKLRKQYPYLKKYELNLLINVAEKNKDNQFLDFINDKKYKHKKLTKKEKKDIS